MLDEERNTDEVCGELTREEEAMIANAVAVSDGKITREEFISNWRREMQDGEESAPRRARRGAMSVADARANLRRALKSAGGHR